MGGLRPLNTKFGLRTFAPAGAPLGVPAQGSDAAPQRAAYAPTSLKIVHMLRAPLGGLFRHVVDVARGQVERGHRVGLIVDSTTGGANAEATLAELAPRLALGILRVPITRELNPRDLRALWTISKRISGLSPDVLHGHGAKGAALARLTWAAPDAIRVYTPHGGSLVYSPGTIAGRLLSLPRAPSQQPHRPVPVRKHLYRRPVPHRDLQAAGAGARRAQWHCRSPNSRRSRRAPMPPTSSASASCGR